MGIQIRNFREGDINLIAVLCNAIEAFDHAQEGTTVDELRLVYTRPRLRPEENCYVAEDDEGRIVAFANLMLVQEMDESGFRTWFNVHPTQRGRGLEDRLLAQLLKRAHERVGEVVLNRPIYFGTNANLNNKERIAAIERMGQKEVRRFWTMVRPNLEGLPEPRFPTGIDVRPFVLGEDDEKSRDADNAAFRDHWGHNDETVEEWGHFLRSPYFRPDLSVLAIDPRTEEVAGHCLVIVNEDENRRLGIKRGLIEILAVRREYRNCGLGEALILQGMRNIRDAGMEQAFLGCDSQNLTGATRLYFRVGFEVAKEMVAYSMYLRSTEEVKQILALETA